MEQGVCSSIGLYLDSTLGLEACSTGGLCLGSGMELVAYH